MRLLKCAFHDLLQRFLRLLRWHIEKEGVEFSHDLSGQHPDGRIACDFTELMSAHAIRHHI